MCGFGVTNVAGIETVNKYCKRRGPDATYTEKIGDVNFLFNLLNTQGDPTPQPYIFEHVAVVFNGDIYNHSGSELQTIVDAYVEYGSEYATHLDGEYSICIIDFSKQQVIISKDPFGTKPLWYFFDGTQFAVTSYSGQITDLVGRMATRLDANTTHVYKFDGTLVDRRRNTTFNLDQFKTTIDGWVEAFEESIRKRSQTSRKIFVGLSSGHDSGAIAQELKNQNVDFKCFSVGNNEDQEVLLQRYLEMDLNIDLMSISQEEYDSYRYHIENDFEDEPFEHLESISSGKGLSHICKKAAAEDYCIYLSGSGADEIISDYGWNGTKLFPGCSCFGGKFPEDLSSIFPWDNVFAGIMRLNLMRDEYIAGDRGVQARYPFLDKKVVQEFLNLSHTIKNSKYKSVITEYLERYNVPTSNHKMGFLLGSTITNSVKLY